MPPVSLMLLALFAAEPGEVWPAFRGTGSSQASARNLPLTWSAEDNVAWSVDLPGYGQSSPVVWETSAFVTSVKGEFKETLFVTCVDVRTGKSRWQREFSGTQKIASSDYVSKGAPTPAVDSERVYAFFESGDVVCLSHDGRELWKRSLTKDYGEFQGNHGVGSSVALTDRAVILLAEHSGPSYLLALDQATGENLWKIEREPRVSWSSPIIVRSRGSEQILISSSGLVEAYAAEDGKRLWWKGGLEKNTVASPSATDELVVIGSSQVGENLAIRRGGEGELSKTDVVWTSQDATSSFGSPLVYRGSVYFVNRAGVVFCVDAANGQTVWTHRLPDSCWASPVGAEDRVYFFTRGGTTVVLRAGPEREILAENSLPTDGRVYGVAAVNSAFLIRTGERLTRVGSVPTEAE